MNKVQCQKQVSCFWNDHIIKWQIKGILLYIPVYNTVHQYKDQEREFFYTSYFAEWKKL